MGRSRVISIAGGEQIAWGHLPESELGLPTRPMLHQVTYPPKVSANGLLVGCLCLIFVVLAGFSEFSLPTPLNWAASLGYGGHFPAMEYTLQLSLTLFLATLLGPLMGGLLIVSFLALGLAFYPLFANGGGWNYVMQPGFGYLLGLLPAGFWLSQNFYRAFQKQDSPSRSLKIVKMAMMAVALVHGVGLIWLLGQALLGYLPWAALGGWMLRLTVETAPYDILITTILLCLVRQIRLALCLVLY